MILFGTRGVVNGPLPFPGQTVERFNTPCPATTRKGVERFNAFPFPPPSLSSPSMTLGHLVSIDGRLEQSSAEYVHIVV